MTQHRDWNVDLGLGRLSVNMFPAKYSFDTGAAPDCVNDYVVYGLNRVGVDGGQANLVAFNQLYTGTGGGFCGAASPSVMFAYNITTGGGRILTSPALSLDGTKIAFVESVGGAGGSAIFHVLTWATGPGNGDILAAATPGTLNTASMTSITFSPTAGDLRSSPWIDYNTDTAYVGDDAGNLYKFTGVFNGSPALAGPPWPVALTLTNIRLTSPVLDKNLGVVLVGAQDGTFFSVGVSGIPVKAVLVGSGGGTNPGIKAPAIVDVSTGKSFVVSSNDGDTGGVLVQVDSASMTEIAIGQIGEASQSGTAIDLYQPAFSDAYYTDPSTGVARLCGTGAADTTPWQYSFGFDGSGVMITTPVSSSQLLASTTARCTGWTEFFNPNVGAGTDFFFFGLTEECTGAATSGCVVVRNGDGSLTKVDIAGGPSGIVVDNFSALPQASSIYFAGETGPPNTAYKLTQVGLQ